MDVSKKAFQEVDAANEWQNLAGSSQAEEREVDGNVHGDRVRSAGYRPPNLRACQAQLKWGDLLGVPSKSPRPDRPTPEEGK